MSIKWIAYELRYCDPGHFVRVFNNREEISSLRFRHQFYKE